MKHTFPKGGSVDLEFKEKCIKINIFLFFQKLKKKKLSESVEMDIFLKREDLKFYYMKVRIENIFYTAYFNLMLSNNRESDVIPY